MTDGKRAGAGRKGERMVVAVLGMSYGLNGPDGYEVRACMHPDEHSRMPKRAWMLPHGLVKESELDR